MKPRVLEPWIYLTLVAITLAVYLPVAGFSFVNFDDPDYAANNPHVRQGLTAGGIVWALTSGEAANWFPLTRLSHLLDGQLFGLNSGEHHLTNVVLHALTACLLLAFLRRATGALWPSAWVACVFALHPLHVESVAWVSERKDVLSAFFWFLTLWLYVRYSERPSAGSYALMAGSFVLGLLAKPMIVTLPFVLLLLDYWPLNRRGKFTEKVPLVALSMAVSVVTFLVQQGSGAVRNAESFPLWLRVENGIWEYAVYIGKMFWPSGLAVFYPYPISIAAWQVVVGALLLAGGTWLAMRRPYAAVGWLWYLGTLVPVIGLIQVGAQARADRYMYIPMVGLTIALAWGAAEWPKAARIAGIVTVLACLPVTWAQVGYWRDSESLFRHAIEVTDDNYLAHHNLGVALADEGRLPEAIAEYQAALRIKPDYARAHTDLGNALSQMPERTQEAVAEYRAALQNEPNSAIPHNNLANTLSRMPGHLLEAITEYEAALRIEPNYAEAHNNLGSALAQMPERSQDARKEFETALRLRPDYPEARANLEKLRNEPAGAEMHYQQGLALLKIQGRTGDGIAQLEEAIRLKPDFAEAHNNLGVALTQFPNRQAEALRHFETAVRLAPGYFDARFNLGIAYSQVPGRIPDAIAQFEAALKIKPDPDVRKALQQLRGGG